FAEGNDFGCASRVRFGDWALRRTGTENDEDAEWYRVENYGVMHCWAVVGYANRREDLSTAGSRPSFFVFLGTARLANRDLELWALQLGARPGSDYLLLARSPAEAGIDAFDVLQTECPRAKLRRGRSVDILLVSYCAIDPRSDLLVLARRMVRRPPL